MGKFSFFKSEYFEVITITDSVLNFAEHSHADDFIISMITEGCGEFAKKSAETEICRGEIFTVLPYEGHSLISRTPASLISLCVKKQAVHGLDYGDFEEKLGSFFSETNVNDETALLLKKAAERIYEKYHFKGTDSSDEFEIFRREAEINPEYSKSLSALAAAAHYSRFHFIRRFKKSAGLTPRKFQIQSRIRKAQRFLNEGRSISDTAAETGFYDQSHFDKYFKSIVGISPSEYIGSVSNILQDKG